MLITYTKGILIFIYLSVSHSFSYRNDQRANRGPGRLELETNYHRICPRWVYHSRVHCLWSSVVPSCPKDEGPTESSIRVYGWDTRGKANQFKHIYWFCKQWQNVNFELSWARLPTDLNKTKYIMGPGYIFW